MKRWKSRLLARDIASTGTAGLRTRRGRTMLTAIGIAIGIASMVSVLGISSSSRAEVIAQIDALGPNLLQVQAGNNLFGEDAQLPNEAPDMVRAIPPVTGASGVSQLDTSVQRNDIDVPRNNGLTVFATEPELLDTLEGSLADGRFLDAGTSDLPVVVLGAEAASRLGIDSLDGGPVVYIAGEPFQVIGILDPLPLNPDIDRAALVGNGIAESLLGADIVPTGLFVRTHPDHVDAVRQVLARTVNPGAPNEVDVSRPSDSLEARATVDENLQRLLLGLGGVALLVGGVGIANVMVISVMERRGEIGLRRALGATRRHIASQFVVESATLAGLGGLIGVVLGAAVTYGYATNQGWVVDVPLQGLVLGVLAALAVGTIAGLHPARRAARLDPADAVRPS
ncbi:MAG: ABC transporter permease [Actinomycetota bacterium]